MFKETELSESKAKYVAALLSMQINTTPLILLGNAESLGYDVLQKLYEKGKESGHILLFAEHDRNEEDIKLVAFDELNVPGEKENNFTNIPKID
jgi:hypothetical protein